MAASTVNTQILDAITETHATLSPNLVRESGAGQAYQFVAQSTAMAVQDAVDYLRNVSMITSTAIGVASARMIKTDETSQ